MRRNNVLAGKDTGYSSRLPFSFLVYFSLFCTREYENLIVNLCFISTSGMLWLPRLWYIKNHELQITDIISYLFESFLFEHTSYVVFMISYVIPIVF